ncbi:MAG: hypothetical protein JRM71_04950, partial [Nitrososphaerota archaeon]|nr:hypothetical protein [Nitrososphaerota archaeon]
MPELKPARQGLCRPGRPGSQARSRKQVGCSRRIKRRKATAKSMYAALDLHEKSIQCVLKDDTGKVVKES